MDRDSKYHEKSEEDVSLATGVKPYFMNF